MKNAIIVLPTYNESENVKTLIPAIFENTKDIKNWNLQILVVDDNSPDNTYDIILELKKKYKNLFVIKGQKEGLGKAYYRGFSYAISNMDPYVLFEMDADWSHDPKLIPQFLKSIENGADFAIGSRYIKGGSIPSDWAWHRKMFSVLGNVIVKWGFMNLRLNDWTSGYRCIKSWFIKEVISEMQNFNGYVFQIALLDRAKKMNLKISEIPLVFVDRKAGKSKIDSVQYITNTLIYVLLNSSFIKFAIVGAIGFVVDFSFSYLFIEKMKMLIWISTIISAEMAIISNFIFNNFWSFSYKKIEGGKTKFIKKFIDFNFVSLGSMIIQTVFLSITTHFFGKAGWPLQKILIIGFLVIPYSYYMYNFVIWKKK